MGSGSLGFGNEVKSKKDLDRSKLFKELVPQDLIRYGLIPELVGRMPVITTLEALDIEALVRILSEPKNALIKQYTQLFSLDGVKLEFTSEALKAVAEKTLKRNTGARGLRSVMEELLTQLMYEVPSDPTIEKIVITGDCVTQNAKPEIVVNPEKKTNRLKVPTKNRTTRRKVTA